MSKKDMSPVDENEPGRRRRKETRPAEIAVAALQVFTEKGFAAARLEDVAERAGTAKGTIYLYYPTKEALFEAVVRDAFAPLLGQIGAALAEHATDCETLLRFVIRTMYRELIGTERREIMRLLIAESVRFPQLVEFYHREAISRGRALLGAVLARGVASGEFRDCPATRHPEVVMGPAVLAGVWKLVFEPVEPLDLETYADAHLDLVLSAIRSEPTRRVR
ncbi:TetR/AcrR family transcriptional regulator [Sphingomonas hankookensis]